MEFKSRCFFMTAEILNNPSFSISILNILVSIISVKHTGMSRVISDDFLLHWRSCQSLHSTSLFLSLSLIQLEIVGWLAVCRIAVIIKEGDNERLGEWAACGWWLACINSFTRMKRSQSSSNSRLQLYTYDTLTHRVSCWLYLKGTN